MNKLQVLGLTVVLTLLASVAFASPLIIGGTGGLILPNTHTQQGWSIGMGKILDNEDDIDNQMWPATQIQLGVLPNLEVGFAFSNDDGTDDAMSLFNAKYAMPVDGFTLAVGAQVGDAGWLDLYEGNKFHNYYVAASKMFGKSVEGTLSLNATKTDYVDTLIPGVTIEKTLESGTKLGVEVLLGTRNNNEDTFDYLYGTRFANVYVEKAVDKQLDVKAGIIGIGDLNGMNLVWLGANYTFGKNLVK